MCIRDSRGGVLVDDVHGGPRGVELGEGGDGELGFGLVGRHCGGNLSSVEQGDTEWWTGVRRYCALVCGFEMYEGKWYRGKGESTYTCGEGIVDLAFTDRLQTQSRV